jgi:hypothetical protein
MRMTRMYPRSESALLEVRETTSPPSEAPVAQDSSALALAEARRDAAAARAEAARLASEREDFEKRLNDRDAEMTRMRTATLPPDQQYQARMAELEANQRRIQEQAAEQIQGLNQRIRYSELALYRTTALKEAISHGAGLIESLVGGSSEEEIDASIEVAKAEYSRIYSTVEQSVAARYQSQIAAQQASTPQPPPMVVQQQVPVYQQPPQNPAYVPQPPPGGGYPTAPAAFQPVPMTDATVSVSDVTTEEAVRSGKYGGAVRDQLMRQMRQGSGAPPGPLGVQPRQLGAVQYVTMPNGVMQPQGLPTPQVVPPQYQQQYPQGVPQGVPQGYQQPPQYQAAAQPQMYVPQAPQVPQVSQGGDAGLRAQALAAVQRTHAGQNPVMSDPSNAGAADAVAASQAFARANGVNGAQAAFQQRFTHTPPIPTN